MAGFQGHSPCAPPPICVSKVDDELIWASPSLVAVLAVHTCNTVLDGILVCDLAGVAPLAFSEQILEGFIVHLNEAGVQFILPSLLLQPLHLIQDLHTHPSITALSTSATAAAAWVINNIR